MTTNKKEFMKKRQIAIETFKQANYDPFTIFVNLQALNLETKEDARDVVVYLKNLDKETRTRKTKTIIFNKKRTNA